jgi:cytochrome b561
MDAPRKYSPTAMALHWLIAALVIYNMMFPPEFEDVGHDVAPEVAAGMTALHIGLGLSILVLMIFRLFWRVGHHAPPLPDTMAAWEARLARTMHWLIYIAVIAMVLLGFATALLAPYPAAAFGVLPVAGFLGPNEALHEIIKEIHHTGNKVIIALVVVHVAAAAYHAFVKKDGVLRSMLPW